MGLAIFFRTDLRIRQGGCERPGIVSISHDVAATRYSNDVAAKYRARLNTMPQVISATTKFNHTASSRRGGMQPRTRRSGATISRAGAGSAGVDSAALTRHRKLVASAEMLAGMVMLARHWNSLTGLASVWLVRGLWFLRWVNVVGSRQAHGSS